MKVKAFLQNPIEIAEEWEENETVLELYRSYEKSTLEQLITYYSQIEANKEATNRKDITRVLREIIAWKLEIPMFDYFIDCLNERFEKLEKEITKLQKFSEHRHKTVMGLYTEKAVY